MGQTKLNYWIKEKEKEVKENDMVRKVRNVSGETE